jgi:PPOX class probable F420-dependent enzyme
MLFTTFRRDGTPVSTPVWVVPDDDGKVGFYTSSGSGKAKRLAHTSRVTVQPCSGVGRVKDGTQPINATAELFSGPEVEMIWTKIRAKYSFWPTITKFLGTVGGIVKRKRIPYGDRAVIVTLKSDGSADEGGEHTAEQ